MPNPKDYFPKPMAIELCFAGDIGRFLEKKGHKLTQSEISTLWEIALWPDNLAFWEIAGLPGKVEGGPLPKENPEELEAFNKSLVICFDARFWNVYAKKPDDALETLVEMRRLFKKLSRVKQYLLTHDTTNMEDKEILKIVGHRGTTSDDVAKARKWVERRQKKGLLIQEEYKARALARMKKGWHKFRCVLPGRKEQTLEVTIDGSDTEAEAVERLKEVYPRATKIELIARKEPPVSVRVRRIKRKIT